MSGNTLTRTWTDKQGDASEADCGTDAMHHTKKKKKKSVMTNGTHNSKTELRELY